MARRLLSSAAKSTQEKATTNFAIIALTPPALGLGGASDLCDSCTDVLCVCCSGCDEEETEASAVALELTRLRLAEEGGGWEEVGVGCAGVELARLRLIVDGCTGVGCAGDSDTLLSNLLLMKPTPSGAVIQVGGGSCTDGVILALFGLSSPPPGVAPSCCADAAGAAAAAGGGEGACPHQSLSASLRTAQQACLTSQRGVTLTRVGGE